MTFRPTLECLSERIVPDATPVSTAVGAGAEAVVVNNPLHVPKDGTFENPLSNMENYEAL
jgi:hypothetical protein